MPIPRPFPHLFPNPRREDEKASVTAQGSPSLVLMLAIGVNKLNPMALGKIIACRGKEEKGDAGG